MDPFTLITGTVGLLDVCSRVVGYLNHVRTSAAKVEGEIIALSSEIETLLTAYRSLQEFLETKHKVQGLRVPAIQTLWETVAANVQQCKATVDELERLLKEIVGKGGNTKVSGKVDGIRKQLRKESKDPDFPQIRQRLSNFQGSLQLLLTTLNL